MRSYEDLDARNGMNRAPRSSRDLTVRYFENQVIGKTHLELKYEEIKYILHTAKKKSKILLLFSTRDFS